ncbi:hypothetical protein DAPPUDRAFT_246979 [Daphnia pulex]|uniref:Uncharacterized protein n=1 Tax=Daphnia pulex TaxID=6669 RepID=E9GRJ0_DAPPU|nr:hypothetical protein DAPPUDRAFT_246979 [Daphnia pulex]|eukprot:EFX77782.1 hypothetical protein DAPPUDRAFT_246979 [Daphnia pulex]
MAALTRQCPISLSLVMLFICGYPLAVRLVPLCTIPVGSKTRTNSEDPNTTFDKLTFGLQPVTHRH